jgi:hypothetical protein
MGRVSRRSKVIGVVFVVPCGSKPAGAHLEGQLIILSLPLSRQFICARDSEPVPGLRHIYEHLPFFGGPGAT